MTQTEDDDAESGGLEVVVASDMADDERGGTAVVLLHGWGAPGDDLVGLAPVLARPRSRFFFPAGPLPEMGGGRAWWHLTEGDRPAHVWDDEPKPGEGSHPQVSAMRAAIQGVLASIKSDFAPERLVLGGFSQGAMLAIHVAAAASPEVDRLVVMSGVMIADAALALRHERPSRPPVFMSHGRHDPLLPFRAAEAAKRRLERHGFAVTWRPFDGGHEIPARVIEELPSFIYG